VRVGQEKQDWDYFCDTHAEEWHVATWQPRKSLPYAGALRELEGKP
jgi:hypothetical protein